MEFAIIAAGAGSRLKQEGITVPKPMLPLLGKPMIGRLIDVLMQAGADQIHIITNSNSGLLLDYLEDAAFDIPVYRYIRDTASSLHSLYELYKANPHWEDCIVTTTDGVFDPADFKSYLDRFVRQIDADAYMAVTPYMDDESPLYIRMDEQGHIDSFSDEASPDAHFVSGGIYGLRRRSLQVLEPCISAGHMRMRNYQRYLLSQNLRVQGHVFEQIVDVDTLHDSEIAEQFLTRLTDLNTGI